MVWIGLLLGRGLIYLLIWFHPLGQINVQLALRICRENRFVASNTHQTQIFRKTVINLFNFQLLLAMGTNSCFHDDDNIALLIVIGNKSAPLNKLFLRQRLLHVIHFLVNPLHIINCVSFQRINSVERGGMIFCILIPRIFL